MEPQNVTSDFNQKRLQLCSVPLAKHLHITPIQQNTMCDVDSMLWAMVTRLNYYYYEHSLSMLRCMSQDDDNQVQSLSPSLVLHQCSNPVLVSTAKIRLCQQSNCSWYTTFIYARKGSEWSQYQNFRNLILESFSLVLQQLCVSICSNW